MIFRLRANIIKAIRSYFWQEGFLEVETPVLVPSLIWEPTIRHFQTDLYTITGKKQKLYLTSSPEASLKKLLSKGSGNIFEITKSFRNYEVGSKNHNSEFSILEWYEVNKNYKQIMESCERMISYIIVCLQKDFKNIKIKSHLFPPFSKIRFIDIWEKYIKIPYNDLYDFKKNIYPLENIAKISRNLGYSVDQKSSWEELFNQIFLNKIEPYLLNSSKSFFLYDFPAPLSCLAQIDSQDARFCQRFELYLDRLEVANCYQELTSFSEQKKRINKDIYFNPLEKKNSIVYDQDYLSALEKGLPKSSGIAVGLDRLIMALLNIRSLNDVLLFPNKEK